MEGEIIARESEPLRQQNVVAVRKYLVVVRPKCEPGSYLPETPMDKKFRGSSRPPVSDSVLALMELNADCISVLSPLISELRQRDIKVYGVGSSDILAALAEDPGCIRRWESGRTAWERKRAKAFDALCMLIAYAVGNRRLTVYTSVSGVAEVGSGEPKTKREGWKMDVRDSYRLIVSEIERIEKETGKPREEVKRILRDEKDWSVGRQNDALAFVKQERGNGNAA